MTDESYSDAKFEPDDDLSITPTDPGPAARPAGVPRAWEMPKPVFRQSGGYDPRSSSEPFEAFEDTTAVPNKVLEDAAKLTAERRSGSTADRGIVEPQPDIAEEIDLEEMAPAVQQPGVQQKSGAAKIVTVLFVLIALIAIVVLFLFVVTYLFLSKGGDGSF
ncbi:MAG: hypothetical protein QUS14_16810 [Pyrinomonadaceae bacterium]|nr:hypothetical protein [Pyrinomonadaceae bacterium]